MIHGRAYPRILWICAILLVTGCNPPVDAPVRDNPNDPDSPYWSTQRPYIYRVSFTSDSMVSINWISATKYGVYFKIERRIAFVGSYALVGTVPGSAAEDAFIDTTDIPRGHTYGYRVGVVGSAGAVTYSYDYNIDIF